MQMAFPTNNACLPSKPFHQFVFEKHARYQHKLYRRYHQLKFRHSCHLLGHVKRIRRRYTTTELGFFFFATQLKPKEKTEKNVSIFSTYNIAQCHVFLQIPSQIQLILQNMQQLWL
jgi:hypothetical protein